MGNRYGHIDIGIVVTTHADGGGEAFLRSLYTVLKRASVSGHLIGDVPGWASTGLEKTSVPLGRKWSKDSAIAALMTLSTDRRRLLKGAASAADRVGGFDVHHLQYKREQVLVTNRLAESAPVVWTEHGTFPRGQGARGLALPYRRAARRAQVVACVSSVVREDLTNRVGLRHPNLIVIENGVDVERFRPAQQLERLECRTRFGVPADDTVVVTSGRLHPNKRIELAIEAMRDQSGVTLLIAGSGNDRDRLERVAGGLPVVFAGQVSDDIELLYRAADVFLLPSGAIAREGFPMALLEAGASGLPAVITSDSGLAPLVEGSGARMVSPKPDVILQAIRELATGSVDGSPLQWASERSLFRSAAQYHELFNAVVAA